jgi:hypothetical protein
MSLLTLICLLTSACDLTLGPKVKTIYVVVSPGKPLLVLSPGAVVKGRVLDDSTGDAVSQDIGGWVAMPVKHYNALAKAAGVKEADAK